MDQYDLDGGMINPQNDIEVLQKMLTGRKTRTEKPVNDIIPTGNIAEEELQLIRRNQEIYSRLDQLKQWLGLEEVPFQKQLVNELNFIIESSKSLGGFAAKMLITRNLKQSQNLSQRFEEEEEKGPTFMEKIAELSQNADSDLGIKSPDPW